MLDNTSSLCTKEYIEKANISLLTAITSTTPSHRRLRHPNGSLCKPSKNSLLVHNSPPCLLLSSEDQTFISRFTEELKRVKAAYFKMFKSFNLEIHSSDPSGFPMFTYEFVRSCTKQFGKGIFRRPSTYACVQIL